MIAVGSDFVNHHSVTYIMSVVVGVIVVGALLLLHNSNYLLDLCTH